MNKKVAHIFEAQIFMPSSPAPHQLLYCRASLLLKHLIWLKAISTHAFHARAAPCRNTNAAQAVGLGLNFAHALCLLFMRRRTDGPTFLLYGHWESEWALGWARKAWSWHIDIKGDLGKKPTTLACYCPEHFCKSSANVVRACVVFNNF